MLTKPKDNSVVSAHFSYTGHEYDPESGLYYAKARYLDAGLGRFISEDTYEGDTKNPLSLNRYTYVENNPIRYVDLTGNSKTYHYTSDDVILMLNIAKYYGEKNQLYWDIKVALGNSRKLSGNSLLYDRELFLDLFNKATSNSSDSQNAALRLANYYNRAYELNESTYNFAMGLFGEFTTKVSKSTKVLTAVSKFSEPWIAKSTFSYITKKFGKDQANLFVKAMQKGMVGPKGIEGIKDLTQNVTKNGVTYTHEIKVLDNAMGNYRILGYFDKDRGQFIFDWFRKGLGHK